MTSPCGADVAEEDSDTEGSEDGERNGPVDDIEEADEPNEPMDVSDEEQEDVVVLRDHKHAEIDQDARADFDREFAKMLTDTTDTRRDRKTAAPIFDTAVPYVKKRQGSESTPDDARMAFTLLSKRGNRQQLRNLDIPLDSSIAVNIRTQQQQNKAEQEHLKRLVLQNERRQDMSDRVGKLDCSESFTQLISYSHGDGHAKSRNQAALCPTVTYLVFTFKLFKPFQLLIRGARGTPRVTIMPKPHNLCVGRRLWQRTDTRMRVQCMV